MEIKNKITLFYTASGIGVGSASAFIPDALWALFFAIFLFYVSCRLVPRVFNLAENPLPDAGPWELVKLGVLPYFLMWLVFWILIYNLVF